MGRGFGGVERPLKKAACFTHSSGREG
jgi:hypothetical protein